MSDPSLFKLGPYFKINKGLSYTKSNAYFSNITYSMSYKATIGLIAFTPEINCDQTAMGLPPVTSAVFLTAK
jgi:hypothetical protein